MKNYYLAFLAALILSIPTHAQLYPQTSPSVRLRDIANIVEARDNQLIGYGLVVGLRNTGDSQSTGFTDAALANLLNKMGVPVGGKNFGSRNVASAMITATLPAFTKKGQTIPVIVSALGDSVSLVGGQLLPTQLMGSDLKPYAIAQGPVLVGGISEASQQSSYLKNQTTVGRIPGGAIVEVEVPVTFEDQHNITIVLNDTSFMTVSKTAKTIQENGFPGAKAIDANTIKIPLADLQSADLVETIAQLQNIKVAPEASAKIVINPRTGTIVIGEMVRLFPAALTHGNISIQISSDLAAQAGQGTTSTETPTPLKVEEAPSKIVLLNPSATLTGLVNALNEIGATPKDLISILQALKEAGALIGQIELI